MRLIFLSGPSGGGKTTFLQLLKTGALPASVRQAFAPDAGTWPVIDITNRIRDAILAQGAAAVWPGLGAGEKAILHYDIVSVHRAGRDGFAADPAFRLLDGQTDVKVAFLRPEPDRLLDQFASRNAERRAGKSRDAFTWTRALRTNVDRLAQRLGLGKGSAEMALYADAVALERLYDDWARFAADLARRHGGHPLLTLTPSTAAGGTPSFALLGQRGA